MAAAVGAEASATAAASALMQLGIEIGGFGGTSNDDRDTIVANVVNHVSALGYNVVCVHPPSVSRGHESVYTLTLQSGGRHLEYKVYVARPHIKMQVTNAGDSGWINWGLKGTNWVRWGNTVKFHPHWNHQSMGSPYDERPASDCPPF